MPPNRKSSRRDFLRGESARKALDELASSRVAPQDPVRQEDPVRREDPARRDTDSDPGLQPTRGASTYLIQIGRPAMATTFQVFLNAGQHTHGPDSALAALDAVERIEDRLSIYRPDSEISQLNDRAADDAVVVSPELFELLSLSTQLAEETDGAFDVTSTPLSKLWGFHDRCGRFPAPDEIAEVLGRVGSHWLQLDPTSRGIRFERPGMQVNLGSIGKGFALDRCADQFEADEVESFLVHGGKSSILAGGNRLGVEGGGWWVALAHPFREGVRLGDIRLVDRALATSGSGNQFFHYQGRRFGHILDPRSGRPVEGPLSTTVVAPTATLADALATAFHVMGREAAQQYCTTRPELGVLFAEPTRRSGGIELTTFGLDESCWRPAE